VIALLHGAADFGAVEEYVVLLATALRERGEPVILVYPDVPKLAPFGELAGGTLRVLAFPPELLSHAGTLTPWLVRMLRREHVRVAHITDVWPTASVAARLAGVRRIVITHHTPEFERRDNRSGRLWWRLSWLVRPLVVYTSAADRDRDGRFLLRRRVVPLGIDVDRFDIESTQDPARPIVGNVARLSQQKGHDTLLDAARLVLERRPDARFALVGDGELRADLEERAARLGIAERVEFMGVRDDVPMQLARFSVFAFPSRFEGLCLAVIEAQAAGVPVVATPVGGIRETVVDGETGLLVPVDDSDALADAIISLLDTPALGAELAARGKAQARAYTRDRTVRETIALYV
jgi:glycosyltransferase involved in cell wall biosynthesis